MRRDFVRKCCGGKLGWLVLVDSLPKLIFGTSRYVHYSRVPAQLTCCVHRSTSRFSLEYRPASVSILPLTMTTTRDSLISIKGHIFKWCALLCLSTSARDVTFHAYHCDKNLKSSLLGTTFFLGCGLSSWIFCSPQNSQWSLLDLSVLIIFTLGKNVLTDCGISIKKILPPLARMEVPKLDTTHNTVIWNPNQSPNYDVFSFSSQHQPPWRCNATSVDSNSNSAPAAVLGGVELMNAGTGRRKREAEVYTAANLIIEPAGMGIDVAGDPPNLAGRRRACHRPWWSNYC